MSRIAVQPLNPAATKAADDELYSSHATDRPRPNALFDADGNRKPLDPDDSTQADLRTEWMNYYEQNGGEVKERESKPPKPIDDPVEVCPEQRAALTVSVKYTPYEVSIKDATVELVGPTPTTGTTDEFGMVEFTDLLPGSYEINVTYDKKHALVDEALKHVGSTDWAVLATRPPYPSGANKCNLFVYEMGNTTGHSIPKRTRFSGSDWEWVWYPPLAGEWADDSIKIDSWSPVTEAEAEPGDTVAEAVDYPNATGHVGIISYPEPNGMSRELAPDENAWEEITLQRRALSAGRVAIVNNDYFWSARRHGVPHYKHYSK